MIQISSAEIHRSLEIGFSFHLGLIRHEQPFMSQICKTLTFIIGELGQLLPKVNYFLVKLRYTEGKCHRTKLLKAFRFQVQIPRGTPEKKVEFFSGNKKMLIHLLVSLLVDFPRG